MSVDGVAKRKRKPTDDQEGDALDKPFLKNANHGKYQDTSYCDNEDDKGDAVLAKVELRVNVRQSRGEIEQQPCDYYDRGNRKKLNCYFSRNHAASLVFDIGGIQ
jgi:hypothetical protein